MHVCSLDALIFVPRPVSDGINLLCSSAGLCSRSRTATSRVIRKYGSWSMAHGIMQRSRREPSTRGNDDENDGAAWIAGNACWPMFESSENPKIARAWVGVPRGSYGVDGDALLDADDVGVHLADVAHVVEDEGLRGRKGRNQRVSGRIRTR